MPALATLIGGSLGLCVQFYSNGVRKLPLMRHPWEHLLAIGLGSAFGNGLVKWEESVQVELEKSLENAREANKKRFIGASLPPSRAFRKSYLEKRCPQRTWRRRIVVTAKYALHMLYLAHHNRQIVSLRQMLAELDWPALHS